MADDAREYLRAAQSAELQGDKAKAVECLEKAAALYRSGGNTTRALQLLRHARRLDGAREDLAEQESRLASAARGEDMRAEGEVDRSRSALDGPVPGSDKQLVERGPTRADASLAAWCSFCCRPKREVGELVQGPAGAFICANCVRESGRLLERGAGASTPPRSAQPERGPEAVPSRNAPPRGGGASVRSAAESKGSCVELVGQEPVRGLVEQARALGFQRALVLGPEGSGKTAYLEMLSRSGAGVYADLAELRAPSPGLILLVDGVERLSPSEQERLVRFLVLHPEVPVVFTARGGSAEPSAVLRSGARRLALRATASLEAATHGRILPMLLERAQLVACMAPLELEGSIEVARRLWALRAEAGPPNEDILGALAAQASLSPRGGHELAALVSRVPSGDWTLESGPAPPKRKPRRKASS